MPEPETVTISKTDYDELRIAQAELEALYAAGVDNWEGFDNVDWPE